jgi:hypothetical protein
VSKKDRGLVLRGQQERHCRFSSDDNEARTSKSGTHLCCKGRDQYGEIGQLHGVQLRAMKDCANDLGLLLSFSMVICQSLGSRSNPRTCGRQIKPSGMESESQQGKGRRANESRKLPHGNTPTKVGEAFLPPAVDPRLLSRL